MTDSASLKTLCIYSGCGGLDLGFSNSGYLIDKAIDQNRFAVETHRKNMPGIAQEGDLSQPVDFGASKFDVVIGGPPCQGFSLAGKRRIDDPRNSHIARFIDIAASANPTLIVMENVPGLLYGELRNHHQRATEALRSKGYKSKTIKLETSDFGVPQHRTRVILIAWKGNRSEINIGSSEAKRSVSDALYNLSTQTSDHRKELLPSTSKDYLIAKRIGAGMKLSNVRAGNRSVHTWHIPEVFGPTSQFEQEILDAMLRLRRIIRRRDFGDADPISISDISKHIGQSSQAAVRELIKKKYIRRIDNKYIDLTHTFNGKYRRLKWDEVSYTVDTYFGNPSYFLHPSEHRGLTIREAARLQTFPDTFEFLGSDSEKYKMIGNAVPPKFAQSVAEQIRKQIWE